MKKFEVMSRLMAEAYSSMSNKESSVVVSIHCSGDVPPNINPTHHNKIRDVLFLEFDDVERDEIYHHIKNGEVSDETYTLKCMSDSQANMVARFVSEWVEKVQKIIVHCDAGASRSVGVCAALEKFFNMNDDIYFKKYSPNMNCYRRTLNALYDMEER